MNTTKEQTKMFKISSLMIVLSLFSLSFANAEKSDSTSSIYSTAAKTPVVEGMGLDSEYVFYTKYGYKFGIGYFVKADIYAGYETDLFYLDATNDYIVFNPILFLEIASHNYIKFDLWYF